MRISDWSSDVCSSDLEGPLPYLGLLSPHGCHRVRCGNPRGHHRRDAGIDHLRAPASGHRPRPLCFDGAEEAGGLFLMETLNSTVRADVAAYLPQHESKGLLRFITCGSGDDGKSTLIGSLDRQRVVEGKSR